MRTCKICGILFDDRNRKYIWDDEEVVCDNCGAECDGCGTIYDKNNTHVFMTLYSDGSDDVWNTCGNCVDSCIRCCCQYINFNDELND